MKKTTTASNPLPAGVQTDRVDRAILRQLQRDASISNVALAEKVNLSPPACLRRVERLREAGLIRATVALLDPKALDAGMLVLIGVILDRSTRASTGSTRRSCFIFPACARSARSSYCARSSRRRRFRSASRPARARRHLDDKFAKDLLKNYATIQGFPCPGIPFRCDRV
jgi:DNA-binding Lrp family transcriptional regulator